MTDAFSCTETSAATAAAFVQQLERWQAFDALRCLKQSWLSACLSSHVADHKDVVVFSNTIGFDAHIVQAFPPLVVGGTLVVARPQGHLDPQYIASLITQHSVTGMVCTVPSLVSPDCLCCATAAVHACGCSGSRAHGCRPRSTSENWRDPALTCGPGEWAATVLPWI